MIGRRRQAEER
uniref:Uncharacterized protein MANES_06G084900 n=1 Tax=Rhizophora mucronata TaxID=61149 RepID=A0A2P2N5A6_RHIMU